MSVSVLTTRVFPMRPTTCRSVVSGEGFDAEADGCIRQDGGALRPGRRRGRRSTRVGTVLHLAMTMGMCCARWGHALRGTSSSSSIAARCARFNSVGDRVEAFGGSCPSSPSVSVEAAVLYFVGVVLRHASGGSMFLSGCHRSGRCRSKRGIIEEPRRRGEPGVGVTARGLRSRGGGISAGADELYASER